MGWVRSVINAPSSGPLMGQAEYHNPTQEWLNALVYAMRNGVRFPVPSNLSVEKPMIVTNMSIRTKDDPYSSQFGMPPVLIRVVEIEYLYEP